MIKLPSLENLSKQAIETSQRFPVVLTFAILGTGAFLWLVDQNRGHHVIVNFIWVSALAISIFTAITTGGERYKWDGAKLWGTRFVAVVLLGIYYLFLPEEFESSGSEAFYRYLLWFLAAHLLVSFSPFISGGNVHEFWAYNKSLFLRLLLSALYVSVLFAGLSIALISLENLLEFNLRSVRYGQVAIFLTGIFGTWFFLSGVPKPDDLTETERSYPNGLRLFVQYVLLPLVVVYIFILYLYMGKILIEWDWPNGWVANLVLSFSITGILALLLLYPIQKEEDHKWVTVFAKGYYVALIPLIVLLMLSIWVRISEYGVTVNRYLVATLAVWLSGMVIYFLISKARNIKVIPISLFLISVLISFGPLSAFEVSERSQLNRLESIFLKHDLLDENGLITKAESEIPFDDRKQISSGIRYLLNLKGAEPLQKYFSEDLDEVIENKHDLEVVTDAGAITMKIGFEFVYDWEEENGIEEGFSYFQVTSKNTEAILVDGFTYHFSHIELWSGAEPKEVKVTAGDHVFEISLSHDTLQINLIGEGEAVKESLGLNLLSVIETIPRTSPSVFETLPASDLTLQATGDHFKVKVVFNTLSGQVQDGELQNVRLNLGMFTIITN